MAFENQYQDYVKNLEIAFTHMCIVDGVLTYIKNIHRDAFDVRLKKWYARIMFLATDPDARTWIENALKQWDETPMFKELEGDIPRFATVNKLLMIKSYREIKNMKKRAKDDSEITPEEIVKQFAKDFDHDI